MHRRFLRERSRMQVKKNVQNIISLELELSWNVDRYFFDEMPFVSLNKKIVFLNTLS